MSKIFLRFLCLLFLSCFTIAQAQTGSPEPKQEQSQVEDSQDKDFFENMGSPVAYKGAFVKMIVTLLALIVLIVISVWMLRRISSGRMKQMNYGRAIKVLERRPLSAKSVLYLVEISGKKVVIAESQIEVRAITTADHLTPEEE